jgi:serine/threonine protein phosphatase 1
MGKQMISWMRELPLFWQNGNLGVVHAGADPEIPLHRQSRRAMIWGHPTFLNHIRADSVCIAHGHTVVDAAEHAGPRIALIRAPISLVSSVLHELNPMDLCVPCTANR